MRTINLQTVYQLVITSLLLGACLGLLGQRLPWLTGAISTFDPPVLAAPSLPMADIQSVAAADVTQGQDLTTGGNADSNIQVEVEVHTRGNANALARALGPGDAEVKASTEGDGDGRSVAYFKAPDVAAFAPSAPSPSTPPVSNGPSAQTGEPIATVTEALVNLRSSPNLAGAVLGNAQRGQSFTIMGRDTLLTWWLVCCDGGQARWVHSGVVEVTGDVTMLPVVAQSSPAMPTSNQPVANFPPPTPAPLPTPAPQFEFAIVEQAQFEERITPRLYVYVYEKEEGLDGYTVRVRKDGRELPVNQQSKPGMPGFTWPLPTDRQRYTNLKLEFPNVTAAGIWEVQLIDINGRAVSPVATFRLQPDDRQQELYVKYRKR